MFTSQRLGVLMIGYLVATTSLLAQGNAAPPPPPTSVEAPSPAQVDPNAAPKAVDPRAYEIGAEDILKIQVWQQP